MSKIDPFVKEILEKYLDSDQLKDAVWPLEKKKKDGSKFVAAWIAKHRYLEIVAAKLSVKWEKPVMIESDGINKNVAMLVSGSIGDRTEWSIGEASPHNYHVFGKMDAYPYSMAEKRGKDRVILKLVGLHGFVYSEEESEDFKQGPDSKQKTDDVNEAQIQWVADQKALLSTVVETGSLVDLASIWEEEVFTRGRNRLAKQNNILLRELEAYKEEIESYLLNKI